MTAKISNDERNALGGLDDAVELILDDKSVQICESYEVHRSVYSRQPSSFSMKIGWGDVVKTLLPKCPANTPFELKIAGKTQFTGRTDGFEVEDSSGGSMVTVFGRDDLAQLHDAMIESDESYKDINFNDLVSENLKKAGIEGFSIVGSSAIWRKATSGTTVTAPVDPKAVKAKSTIADNVIQFKAGEHRFARLKKELDRAGLFLWAAPENKFILAAPTIGQNASCKILRRRQEDRNIVSTTTARWRFDTAHRYASYEVLSRVGHSGKHGRYAESADYVDPEMTALGYKKKMVIRETHPKDIKTSKHLARRKASEDARRGWQLNYTVAGHTVVILNTRKFMVWSPDIVAQVEDDEYDLHDDHYVEAVAYKRGSKGTQTDVSVQRKKDLVFGGEDP